MPSKKTPNKCISFSTKFIIKSRLLHTHILAAQSKSQKLYLDVVIAKILKSQPRLIVGVSGSINIALPFILILIELNYYQQKARHNLGYDSQHLSSVCHCFLLKRIEL